MSKFMLNNLPLMVVAGALSVAATPAEAGITFVGDQAAFNSLGTISQNTNFDSYGTGWTYLATPYTVGQLTWVAGGQALVGGISAYGTTQAVFTDDYVLGTTVQVSGSYNMFAFDAADLYGAGPITLTVVTNLGTYDLSRTIGGPPSLEFLGFVADVGEDILSVYYGGRGAAGGTNFQVGNQRPTDNTTSPVPETASWALMLGGFGAIGSAMRLRRRRVAVSFG